MCHWVYTTRKFTTATIDCQTFSAGDTPIQISSGAPATYTSTINMVDDIAVLDVNVTVDITHTYVGDLVISLQSPAGTVVELQR